MLKRAISGLHRTKVAQDEVGKMDKATLLTLTHVVL